MFPEGGGYIPPDSQGPERGLIDSLTGRPIGDTRPDDYAFGWYADVQREGYAIRESEIWHYDHLNRSLHGAVYKRNQVADVRPLDMRPIYLLLLLLQ